MQSNTYLFIYNYQRFRCELGNNFLILPVLLYIKNQFYGYQNC